MLANRREAFATRLPQIRERDRALNLAGADERYQALRTELEQVERDADAAAFATLRERELQVRLDRVHETLEHAGSDPEFTQARERYRRAAGALLWQQSDQFAVRLWSAKKGMQELQRNLSEAQQHDAALATAERDEPARLDAFAGRIDALAARVEAMVPRVAELAREQGNAVQELAVADLLRQKERLAAYGTQARFAVAQIYDRASTAREDGRAPYGSAGPSAAAAARGVLEPVQAAATRPADAEVARIAPVHRQAGCRRTGQRGRRRTRLSRLPRRFAARTQRQEALRRLGDLEMDMVDTRSASGATAPPTTSRPLRSIRTS
jgi:hypothetical protein